MTLTKAKRNTKMNPRKLLQLRDSELRWLQKVLFDLDKVKAAREKLAEANGEKLNPLLSLEDGTSVDMDQVAKVVNARVEELMDVMGKGRYGRRKRS